ncbi:uncharacterized protein MYCFIDRAFT_175475 [Pseudocercospora fijiensis CIRAD86]|uniref:Uncharacterized protein n=1 Tax=Pseudocercospora fijiensis (strain CIRAD86) TaxID=383855 RepID=M2YW05_PSEFD|nr:uncharacterized protein MYCFIDRAFT_175475 [Pseudocercospora fijiensis CIRAD86]EME81895.1 hypothetical protein MYCFIDRAFT_175475 [Pseudocercospora fijiensis CIRAD86]
MQGTRQQQVVAVPDGALAPREHSIRVAQQRTGVALSVYAPGRSQSLAFSSNAAVDAHRSIASRGCAGGAAAVGGREERGQMFMEGVERAGDVAHRTTTRWKRSGLGVAGTAGRDYQRFDTYLAYLIGLSIDDPWSTGRDYS